MKNKPVYLNLFQFKFPATAIASILHRISGVVLFLCLPLLLWVLTLSLESEESYASLHQIILHPLYKWIWAGFLIALFYHLFAGLRHLIMDLGYGDGKTSGRIGAYAVMGLTALFTLWLGSCIW